MLVPQVILISPGLVGCPMGIRTSIAIRTLEGRCTLWTMAKVSTTAIASIGAIQ